MLATVGLKSDLRGIETGTEKAKSVHGLALKSDLRGIETILRPVMYTSTVS